MNSINLAADSINGVAEHENNIEFILSVDYLGPILEGHDFYEALKDVKDGEEIRGVVSSELAEKIEEEYGIKWL